MADAALERAAKLMALMAERDAATGNGDEDGPPEDAKVAAAQEKSRSGWPSRLYVWDLPALTLEQAKKIQPGVVSAPGD